MRLPTMWYVRPAKAQTSLRICADWSEPLLKYSMTVKLLTEHHLEFLSLKGGRTSSSESTHVKVPNCWKSHVTAQMLIFKTDPLKTVKALTGTMCQGCTITCIVQRDRTPNITWVTYNTLLLPCRRSRLLQGHGRVFACSSSDLCSIPAWDSKIFSLYDTWVFQTGLQHSLQYSSQVGHGNKTNHIVLRKAIKVPLLKQSTST